MAGICNFGFFKFQEMNHPYLGINPQKLTTIVTDKELANHRSELERMYGFPGKDLSEKDMSKVSLEVISNIAFDNAIRWPKEDNLPKGFDPSSYISKGKDPGLNLSKIHNMGITGKGVAVAVIDKP